MKRLVIGKLVAFSILMENNLGILEKSPDYILEKFRLTELCSEEWQLEGLLDMPNQVKYKRYMERWIK